MINYDSNFVRYKLAKSNPWNDDCITPISLFEKDERFFRKNITIEKIKDAGHFPWLEKMEIIKGKFEC